MAETVFAPCLEGIKHIKSEQGDLLTKPLLDVCKLVLPILVAKSLAFYLDDMLSLLPEMNFTCFILLDKFGAAMTVVKSDIGGNISRLEHKYNSNTSRFNYLYNMVQAEVETKTAKSSCSCTNGILWLTRAMDFLVELFRNLCEHQDWSMSQVCNDAYSKTLRKWHGWLASSSFSVAIKLAPDRKKFMEVIGTEGDIYGDMQKFCTNFSPILGEIHKFLASFGLDSMKSS
ncbi:UNVERIFIED_CONTAM: Glycolipid transfer protein 1 [Sesamum radiatum]|uniref:Glycolipid transfer protein 1 n=1 Tax=Sesamum radiatum TaxID=300843 RepID=A0AAW2UAD0_SESRA